MCGILCIFNIPGTYEQVRRLATTLSRRLKHRGPDASGIQVLEGENGTFSILSHERLQICDLTASGDQPFILKREGQKPIVFVANGEIYNYHALRDLYEAKYPFQGTSDCEVIGALYNEYGGKDMWEKLNGMFGVIVFDQNTKEFHIARDHVGIIPLYWGIGKHGEVYVSSELKAIESECVQLSVVLPGHYIDNRKEQIPWYQPEWYDENKIPTRPLDLAELREQLSNAVLEQLQGDAPFGLFISGGVDSSLVASITVRLVNEGKIDISKRGMKKVHSFCIGLQGSPDIAAAQEVATFLGTQHHAIIYTPEEGIDAIPDVIYHTETYNNTTIRASTPMYLLARKIKALGIKYCLTGEGADEILAGYLYFHKAPNAAELHSECVRKVKDLYKYDLLRANKSGLAWGLEIRPPFLHKPFIDYAMSIDPVHKVPKNFETNIEKHILRAAFDDKEKPYLPASILWRQKEQFSDGVGYLWRDSITEYSEKVISDDEFKNREITFPINTPRNKEQYLYRQCFSKYFPSDQAALTVPYALSIACSTEKALEWDESFKTNTDESGRAVLGVHASGETLKGTSNDHETVEKNSANNAN